MTKLFYFHRPSIKDDKNLNGNVKLNSHKIVEENIIALNDVDSNSKEKKKEKHKSKDKHRERKSKKSKNEDKNRPAELDLLGISPPKSVKTDAEKDTNSNKHHKKSKKEKHHRKEKSKASEYEEALGISTPSKEMF